GHVVAMYGYDDARAYLVDTGQQGGAVTTSLGSLADARAERGPMTARNRSFTLHLPDGPPAPHDQLAPAIRACAEEFLNPPIGNLGYRGVDKAAAQVRGWLRRSADPRKDLPQAARLMEKAGTGGALFRNLYRDFLGECADLIDDRGLRTGHALYAEAAPLWTEVAALIAQAGADLDPAPLTRASDILRQLSRLEHDAMVALSGVRA
ncbi:MAG TPA: DUF4872 domain-containing protein, partial [Streptomyces sp.]